MHSAFLSGGQRRWNEILPSIPAWWHPAGVRRSGAGYFSRYWFGLAVLLVLGFGSGCSVRHYAISKLGDALAQSGSTFASDNDPELVRQAVPFSLKLIEGLLAENPRHQGLLLAAARGFTQYSYAFVQEEADETEPRDLKAANTMRDRARGLYLRACQYGMRSLELRYRDFEKGLRRNAQAELGQVRKTDVASLYWTAVAWAAAIAVGIDQPDLVADLPLAEAMLDRALALDADYDAGALHEFMIAFEFARRGKTDDPIIRARQHFDRVMELSGGHRAGPLVSLAENVSVTRQNAAEFKSLLAQALAVDVNARPEWRLENLVMQRRARWLMSRVDDLFLILDQTPEKAQ